MMLTRLTNGVETFLGMDSNGIDRPNTTPCP
jgi:hypothetical protein